jgi:hypothetical protein
MIFEAVFKFYREGGLRPLPFHIVRYHLQALRGAFACCISTVDSCHLPGQEPEQQIRSIEAGFRLITRWPALFV